MHFRFEDHDTAVVNNIHLILTVLKCNNFSAAPDDVQSDERRQAVTWMGRSWYDHHDLTYATVPSSLLRSWWVPPCTIRRRPHNTSTLFVHAIVWPSHPIGVILLSTIKVFCVSHEGEREERTDKARPTISVDTDVCTSLESMCCLTYVHNTIHTLSHCYCPMDSWHGRLSYHKKILGFLHTTTTTQPPPLHATRPAIGCQYPGEGRRKPDIGWEHPSREDRQQST